MGGSWAHYLRGWGDEGEKERGERESVESGCRIGWLGRQRSAIALIWRSRSPLPCSPAASVVFGPSIECSIYISLSMSSVATLRRACVRFRASVKNTTEFDATVNVVAELEAKLDEVGEAGKDS